MHTRTHLHVFFSFQLSPVIKKSFATKWPLSKHFALSDALWKWLSNNLLLLMGLNDHLCIYFETFVNLCQMENRWCQRKNRKSQENREVSGHRLSLLATVLLEAISSCFDAWSHSLAKIREVPGIMSESIAPK